MNPNQSSTPRFKRIVALAAVGVAIPVFAFFVGSQSGGGDLSIAQAAKSSQAQNGNGRGGPPQRNPFDNDQFVEDLAAKLGVTTDALQNALDEALPTPPTRKEMRAKKEAELTKLADAMGVSTADLKAAMKMIDPRGGPHGRGHQRGNQRGNQGDRGSGPGPGGQNSRRPHGPKGGPGAKGGPPAKVQQKLADELNIDVSKVKAAFKQARADHEAEKQARQEKFAADLATALGIDASKVTDALEQMRPDDGPDDGPGDGPDGGPHGRPHGR